MKPNSYYSLGTLVDYMGRAGYITKIYEHTDPSPHYDYGYYDIYLFKEQKTKTVVFGIHLEPIKLTGNKKET